MTNEYAIEGRPTEWRMTNENVTVEDLQQLIIDVRKKHNKYSTIEIKEKDFDSYIEDDLGPLGDNSFATQTDCTLQEVAKRFRDFLERETSKIPKSELLKDIEYHRDISEEHQEIVNTLEIKFTKLYGKQEETNHDK